MAWWQITQGHAFRHQQAAPDGGPDAAKRHFQADDAVRFASGLGHDRSSCGVGFGCFPCITDATVAVDDAPVGSGEPSRAPRLARSRKMAALRAQRRPSYSARSACSAVGLACRRSSTAVASSGVVAIHPSAIGAGANLHGDRRDLSGGQHTNRGRWVVPRLGAHAAVWQPARPQRRAVVAISWAQNPSRSIRLRSSLRARRTASAASRARRSDGFS